MTALRTTRALAVLACAAVVTTAIAYALLLQGQQSGLGEATTSPWTALRGAPTWLLVMLAVAIACTAVAMLLPPSRGRRLLLVATATLLSGVGLVGIFSIGLGLLLAAGLCLGSAAADSTSRGSSARGPATTGVPGT